MKITFHGAARCVTGSKHLVETASGLKILFDCGMFQGNPREADELNRHLGFNPGEVSFVLLSHAHVDHCGLIPKLVKEGFKGKVYCTPGTYDLAEVLMLDSAHIQEETLRYQNKRRRRSGKTEYEPLYTNEDVEKAMELFEKVNLNTPTALDKSTSFTFTDAGHLLGSAVVNLVVNENGRQVKITFSGDVGRYNDEILSPPAPFPQADYVILESTYGDRLHEESEVTDKRLLDIIINTCIKKRGKLIIPAFSVGRTQELTYALNRLDISGQLPPLDFFVDSPLSSKATAIIKKHTECFNEKILEYMKRDPQPFDFKRLTYITDVEESKALNVRQEPCVIISASGMAEAGRIKHHIKSAIADNRNTILFSGYCEPNSLGGKLLRGQKQVSIFGEAFDVQAEIKSIKSLSSHADHDDLMDFLSCQDAAQLKRIFLVHGDYDAQITFRGTLMRKNYKHVEIPSQHQTFEL